MRNPGLFWEGVVVGVVVMRKRLQSVFRRMLETGQTAEILETFWSGIEKQKMDRWMRTLALQVLKQRGDLQALKEAEKVRRGREKERK